MGNEQRPVTAAEIRKSFFAGPEIDSNEPMGGAGSRQNRELSASARFVVKEARKWIGAQSSNSSAGRSVGSSLPQQLPDEDQLITILRDVERSEGEELSDTERDAALATLKSSFEYFDVLAPLVQNPAVNDIIVRAFDDVSIQIGRKNVQTDTRFPDHSSYKSFVENLLKRTGKTCTLATPVVDAALDQHIRACVTHESFSPPGSGPMLTLRIARHGQISLERLAQNGLAPSVVMNYLAAVIRSGAGSALVAGEVGTGKTTLVRALAENIEEDESILVIEDTNEIVLSRRFVRTLLTREANTEGAGRISPAQAIRAGMRMAMNRIILGEMRDAETAEAFIDVCASGHPGMSTIHSRSARDALSRLELFLLRAQGNVGVDTVRRQISNAISLVIFLDVEQPSGSRRIRSILEVGSAAEGEIQVAPMFSAKTAHGGTHWIRESGISMFTALLRDAEIVLPQAGTALYAGDAEVREC